ncbi:MAG: FliI/YscN family ATPase [Gemmataceae bacterium]|jgi:flagellum-specific ATP synthase|nr:FliI/YscN family ATPase [Gemmataceae bacterium]
MLGLDLPSLTSSLRTTPHYRVTGKLLSCRDVLTCRLSHVSIGDHCEIITGTGQNVLAEVIGFDHDKSFLVPYDAATNLRPGQTVVRKGNGLTFPVGDALLGRTVDGLGRPVDDGPVIRGCTQKPIHNKAPKALSRREVEQPFLTGQRSIDSLLTCGVGQRIGIFAGSGVGKSTLLGEIAKGTSADINVIALIGERGREALPFLKRNLGPDGMSRSIMVLATCDETPLMRIRAALAAIAIAEHYRDQGKNVLFMIDSLTRLAMAQRDIGQMRGEVPTTKGYTASCLQMLATTVERLGNGPVGSITALLTVLVDGGDMDEPIADAVRGFVDGHIVLDRKMADRGFYPAINPLASISRVQSDIVDEAHLIAARKLKHILATLKDAEEMVRFGLYTKGVDLMTDRALELKPRIENFLKQKPGERTNYADCRNEMFAITSAWPY